MADHYFGSIDIPRCLITLEIQKEIDAEGLSYEGEEKGVVTFTHEGASNGQFNELEGVLVEKGIAFDRYSSGFCEHTQEKRYFRPAGISEVVDVEVALHPDHGEFIPVSEIKEYISLSAEEFKSKMLMLIQKWSPGVKPLSDWAATKKSKENIIASDDGYWNDEIGWVEEMQDASVYEHTEYICPSVRMYGGK